MKLITFTVPCYNSEAYMRKCLDSLLVAGEDAEIIIVDDGSKDATGAIADEYAANYPTIVRAIHQPNGGHGTGVNQGIEHATGLYFKVVDSDDWLDPTALKELISMIRKLHALRKDVDAFICNYVYEHVADNTQLVINYRNVFPQNKVFRWKDVRPFKVSQYLMMHSLIIRTGLLRDANVKLPAHTFYVDNIFVCSSLAEVRKMCYLNIDLYRYFIGRADQSVNDEVFMGRIDQHLLITNITIDNYDRDALRAVDPHLERYITRHIAILCATASVFLIKIGGEEADRKRLEFWENLKNKNPRLYKDVRSTTFAGLTDFKSDLGRKVILKGYDMSRKVFKYN